MKIIIKKQGFLNNNIGDIASVSTERASHLVKIGFAEYVEKPKEEKPKKKTFKKENAASKKKPEKAVK
ncbi:MAG: hypothetical protein GY834_13840 [Bacteroidetes bacterium]|nr:hypothetical protein [Bacteroidota bacterium]